MPETTKPVKGSTDYVEQRKCMAMGEKIEGEPSFGCRKAGSDAVPFGRKAADTTGSQKLPGFAGPMDPPYKG